MSLPCRYRLFLLSILFLLLQSPLNAQDSSYTYSEDSLYSDQAADAVVTDPAEEEAYTYTAPHDRMISQADWDSLCSDKAFSYRHSLEQETRPEKPATNGFWFRLFRALFAFLASGIGQLLFWGVILFVFGYILYRVLKGELGFILGRKERRDTMAASDTGAVTEEDLLSANWEHKLQEAISVGDPRLATRFALMRVLQLLQEAELIRYRIDKTNHEYYLELGREELRQPFRDLLLRYEFAWFGRFAVSAEDWAGTRAIYEQVKHAIAR